MYPWLNETFKQLCKRAEEGGLHHGLLFKGPSGIGKAYLSHHLAQSLLCKTNHELDSCSCQSCQLFRSGSHPDFHVVESEKQIGVDAIREAIQKLSGMAQLSGNKVLIVRAAHTMTESSANALLKTLEEPTERTFIMLVSSEPERLLPTILSRCEKVSLAAPNVSQCKQWLSEKGFDNVDDSFIRLYHQAPLLIQQELQQDKGLDYQTFLQLIAQISSGQIDVVEVAETYNEDTHKIVPWLQHHICSEMEHSPDNQLFWDFYRQCRIADDALRNPGINKVILLSGLLSKLSLLTRPQITGAHS